MKKILFKAFFLFLILSSNLSQGQGGLSDYIYWYPLTPQASDFMKYGNTPVSLFTGETNITIPIYTYKDNDFDIPIFLGYNSSGFNPNKSEGIVGLNWFLNAGGIITRKVNGWPDDKIGEPGTVPNKLHGLYYGIKNNLSVKTSNKSDIFNNLPGSLTSEKYWNMNGCEVEPDEFTITAPGCNCRFFIENNGSVRCEGNKNYIVNLNNFSIQPTSGTSINNSEIIITSDDGYKYYFGGSIQYLEVSYPLDNNAQLPDVCNPQIVGWYLTKIVAPNGREAKYYYRPFTQGFFVKTPLDKVHYIITEHDVDFSSYSSLFISIQTGVNGYLTHYEGTNNQVQNIHEVTKTAYLEKIEIGFSTIEFSYQQRTNKFYPTFYSEFNLPTLGLSNIYINHNNITLKTFTLGSAYNGGTDGQRYFLTSVQETGKNPYTFSYYKQTQIPTPLTHGIDYWGFWNGGTINMYLIPSMNFDQDGTITYTSNIREPDESKCDVGMLEQINYPTGGNTHFAYEAHRYSKRLERRVSNGFLPALYNQVGIAGGCRIHEIKDDDGTGNIITKTYDYFSNYPSTTTSSGILLEWPRYLISWRYKDVINDQVIIKKQSDNYNVNHSCFEKYIQYSEVTERIEPSGGCTVYKFTNYTTNPDLNDYHSFTRDPSYSQNVINLSLFNNYKGIKLNDCAYQRGYPYEISVYSSDGTKLKKKSTTAFTSLTDYPDNYAVSVQLTGGIAQSHKLFYAPFLPKTEVDTTYLTGGNVTLTKNYTYNSYNLVSEITQNNSMNGILKNKFRYSVDCKDNVPYDSMFGQNILKTLLENTALVNGMVTASTLTTYRTGGGSFVPDKTYKVQTGTPLGSFTYFNGDTKDQNYTGTEEVSYQDYDSNGNILKYKKKDGITTYLVWGYNNKYPVASIDATSNTLDFTSIRSTISGHNFTNDVFTEVAYLKTQLGSYFNNTGCLVNLYTFSPLYGMSSKTDQTGVTSYYTYDLFGKLITIKNDDQQLLKKFDYHYINQ